MGRLRGRRRVVARPSGYSSFVVLASGAGPDETRRTSAGSMGRFAAHDISRHLRAGEDVPPEGPERRMQEVGNRIPGGSPMISKTAVLAAILGPALGSALAAGEASPARWMPRQAVVYIELARPGPILDALLDRKLEEAVRSFEVFRRAAGSKEVRDLLGLVTLVEGRTGADWRTVIRRALAGGLALAVLPDGSSILAVDAADAKILEDLNAVLADLARGQAAGKGGGDPVSSRDRKGTAIWTMGPNESHAIVGKRLLLANRPAALEAVLDLREAAEEHTLESSPAFRAARKAAGDPAGSLFVDLEALKRQPGVAKALDGGREPMASLLFADVLESLKASSWLSAALRIDGGRLVLEAAADRPGAGADGPSAFAVPPAGSGALPDLPVPRRIAAISLHRDLHGFYEAKDRLFPERTAGLIFFENMMGIFFSGMDLTEEVFAEIGPEVRLAVAEQAYDPAAGTPKVKLPGFALVLRLRNPEKFGDVLEEAWQKALGLVNFTRGQQAQQGMVLDRPEHAGVRLTVAAMRPPRAGSRSDLDMGYNFRPTLARVGEWAILSSTDGLARDLIDALGKGSAAAPAAGVHGLVEIDGPGLLSILAANREAMVLNNMVEKGHGRENAEGEIGTLLDILEWLGGARLTLGTKDGLLRASFEMDLRSPAGKKTLEVRAGGGAGGPAVAGTGGRDGR